ncbi:M23 family metallopeptidase [Thermoactinomyces sp. DSM 45892]|uniref:LysM peptidoglycan-binding domain-containing M23 family metallopeptidase n=1 Tax=Thermoactinomyces sp. DSM 45892 TaxID=1882753 RepID=UPI0008957562|nr:M23 family metallopeptidase [Thermoactinomyces sp. DSM 45892]SDY40780.1 Murein DD-endopeptidase MepM and murein hydrolase activator NlpD, contain LysM domain [Thermoactinomyces sp. DSM 45892]
MSRKKALLASSLAICSASTAWAIGTDSHSILGENLGKTDGDGEPLQITMRNTANVLPKLTYYAGSLAELKRKPILYRVQRGDTLSEIGSLFQVPHPEIANQNEVQNPRLLSVGRNLTIPLRVKLVAVRSGDTIDSVASTYRTTKDLLLHLNPSLGESPVLSVDSLLFVPKEELVALPEAKQDVPKQSAPKKQKMKVSKTTPANKKSVKQVAPPRLGNERFIWPVNGRVTSNFGWRNGRQHKGVDIWSEQKSKEPIFAAASGTVVKAGYSGAYGNLVVIDHGDGWVTYYAHLSRILVGKGSTVSRGEQIGFMGITGNATGYHLHFEVHKNGSVLNPLQVLPK